jgi:hypothetical protein
MKRPPIVETKGELLEIREQREVPDFGALEVDSTARLQWTPSTGWRIAEPYRARRPIPQPREFGGGADPGNDCRSMFESRDTIRLGSRLLTVGTSIDAVARGLGTGPWLLAFGCEALIGSGPRLFDLTSERQIGTASVMLSTEYNAGNGGFVDRHVLADVLGHGIQVWEFPKSEVGVDNDAAAVATSFGYQFLTAAYPGMDGGIFRWTPLAGFIFEGYRSFTPALHGKSMPKVEAPKPDEDPVVVGMNLLNNEEVYQALASAAGPSFIGLAFDLSAGGPWSRMRVDRQWAPDLVVFSDCDGSRFCNDSGGRMIAVFRRETRRFYFIFRQDRPEIRTGMSTSLRPPVGEYHPPLAFWPGNAANALQSLLDGRGLLLLPDND